MKLLVGLGNPGEDYAAHRHNIGFMVVARLQEALRGSGWQKKFHGLLATAMVGEQKLLLLKPQTYMNRSGLSVAETAQFYKIPLSDIIVFHDELELAPGKIRVKQGGGAAGHNGLKSLDAVLGQGYWRVRLGIGRPLEGREAVHDYVLHDFTKAEQFWLQPLLEALVADIHYLLNDTHSSYMNRITLAVQPHLPLSDSQD